MCHQSLCTKNSQINVSFCKNLVFPTMKSVSKRRGGVSPLSDIPSGGCSFTGPWTVTRSSLRMLRRVAAFCRPLRPVLLLVSFPRSRSPVVGVLAPPPPNPQKMLSS